MASYLPGATGTTEKKSIRHLWEESPSQLENFWTNPYQFTPNNAEPFSDFLTRLSAGLTQLKPLLHQQRLLIVTHAGVIRAATLIAVAIAESLSDVLAEDVRAPEAQP